MNSEPDPWPAPDADPRDDKTYDSFACGIPAHTDHTSPQDAQACNQWRTILGIIAQDSPAFTSTGDFLLLTSNQADLYATSMLADPDPRFYPQPASAPTPASQQPTINFEERVTRIPQSLEAMMKE
jgi:hypothetical protein